ncbi:MAG: alpha/beta fold hydrolase [Methylococcaceae bacterium]|nr:MAG: alpha/beta fold hydrolase [Methylococcaceae bacterium]
MPLVHACFGDTGPTVLILHGLLGSGRNWHAVAQCLSDRFRVAVPDLRNHGASPHRDVMDYPSMAADVLALLDALQWPTAHVIGHSMGGKLAIHLSMAHPERVSRVLVADIAPADYPDHHQPLLDALEALPLAGLNSRQEADARLTAAIPQATLRRFLLQNLITTSAGYRWRVNLPSIRANLPALLAAPAIDHFPPYQGATLFLAGERSDYVRPEHYAAIGRHFCHAHIRTLHGAGHWLHVDQPEAFLQAAREFLG